MVLQELRHALRNLVRVPRFSFLVITTLAIAVGGVGGLFSLLNAVVLRPITSVSPERLVAVYPANGDALLGITMPTLVELISRQQVFDEVCAISRGGAMVVEVGGARFSRASEAVSGVCYQMLGVQPWMGRLIGAPDTPLLGDPAAVVLISHRLWVTVLGSDPDAVGQTLRVMGSPLTIIGVMPPGFHGYNADEAPDVMVPLSLSWKLRGSPSVLALHAVGRLRPGQTVADARSQLRVLWPEVWKATNPPPPAQRGLFAGAAEALQVESLSGGFSDLRRYSQPLYALVALAVLLLSLAAINVGGLFLARTISRAHELAVQRALGADRTRLIAQLSAEAMLLACAAAAVAVPIAYSISGSLAAMVWTNARPLTMRVTPDADVLLAIVVTAVTVGLLVSLPAVLLVTLRPLGLAGGHVRTVVAASASWRRSLSVAQVAVSLILLFVAVLFVRNLHQIRSIDPGYPTSGLQWARLEPSFGSPQIPDQPGYYRELLARISALPQVTSASLASSFPSTEMRHITALQTFVTDGDDPSVPEARGTMDRTWPGFFAAVRIALLQGRDFTMYDTTDAPQVAIINKSLADRLFPANDAPGRRIRIPARSAPGIVRPPPDQVLTIVGVVGDASPGDLRISNHPQLYRPVLQALPLIAPTLIIRQAGDQSLRDGVQKTVEALGYQQMATFRSLEEQTNRFLIRERVLVGLSASFAGLGVLVGALGLYGLLAYTVARRTRELGVRMALGATRERVVAMVVREGVILTLAGVLLGVPLALLTGRSARALLFELSPFDPLSLSAAVAVLFVIGLAAAGLPAIRVARIHVAEALRYE